MSNNAVVFFDTDGDGCTDFEEDGLEKLLGGLRDKNNRWDFYDVDGTRKIDAVDVGAVRSRFNPSGPLPPADQPYDRGPGAAPWAPGAPDGKINAMDIGYVRASFNHSCEEPP